MIDLRGKHSQVVEFLLNDDAGVLWRALHACVVCVIRLCVLRVVCVMRAVCLQCVVVVAKARCCVLLCDVCGLWCDVICVCVQERALYTPNTL